MLQGSAATALSPSDLSIIQQVHECTSSGVQVWAHPPYWVDYTILMNHAPNRELMIYSEMIMFCFNHSLADSLAPSTQQFGQCSPRPHGKVPKLSPVPPPGGHGKWLFNPIYIRSFNDRIGIWTSNSEAFPNREQAICLNTICSRLKYTS